MKLIYLFFYLVPELTCWIFYGENLGGFTWVSTASLVLSSDLELNLCSLNDVCYPVLTVWTRGLPTFHPASSKLLFFLNGIPEHPMEYKGNRALYILGRGNKSAASAAGAIYMVIY